MIARAILERDPAATATLVTGLPFQPPWGERRRMSLVRVPPLLKDIGGAYRASGLSFDAAIQQRRDIFCGLIDDQRPRVVVVDRHPYGTAGELRAGLIEARAAGTRLVLGLRDVLDEPAVVRVEIAGDGWDGVGDLFDQVLVYGAPHVCDHEAEYGLPVQPRYCGWVVGRADHPARVPNVLAASAGGGGDGTAVFSLAVALVEALPGWRGHLASGPYADTEGLQRMVANTQARDRIVVDTGVGDCARLFAGAAAVLEMAGYNSTYEALAAGQRPVLVPRRAPRREQAIRAERLAALGLCDVVPEGAEAADVAPLLDGRRQLTARELHDAGIDLDGAPAAARILEELALVAHT